MKTSRLLPLTPAHWSRSHRVFSRVLYKFVRRSAQPLHEKISLLLSPSLHSTRILWTLNFASRPAMDRQPVYSLSVLAPDQDAHDESRSQIQSQLRDFILEFRLDNAFIYRYDRFIDRWITAKTLVDHLDLLVTRSVKTCSSSSTTVMSTLHI